MARLMVWSPPFCFHLQSGDVGRNLACGRCARLTARMRIMQTQIAYNECFDG